MKRIALILGFVAISAGIYATNYATVGAGGNWTSDAIWSGAGIPDDVSDNATIQNSDSVALLSGTYTINLLTFSQNGKLYIAAGAILIVNNIIILNNADFYVDGTIIVNNDILMANNSTLTVDLTGSLAVSGNFVGTNNVSITNDGDMVIDGALFLGNGSELTGEGTVDAATYSGTGTVFGTPMGSLIDGATYYDGGSGATVLPVKLINFSASYLQNFVDIRWSTASEINNDYFVIEYSTDAVNWEILGYVQGNGNSSVAIEYQYQHFTKTSSYYRLKQVDYDGKSETFSTVFVNSPYISEDTEYQVYDIMGRYLMTGKYNEIQEKITQHGQYILKNRLECKKIIK